MATDVTSMPVNGNYAPHQGYGGIDQQQNTYAYNTNSSTTSQAPMQTPSTSTTPAASASNQQSDVPKDEVGWYFVEQYYTTLSRSPEKLYLFYNKRSQFVSGQETDKVAVCVGQRAINDRIKELDFQDCKVRVTNVDSQASDVNIVIQVIGEISNKSQPHKKFTQTFVLATQTNGYFVLNDIFRYLIDEEDEPEPEVEPATEEIQQAPAAESGSQEPAPTATEVEPKTLTSSIDPIAVENDAKQVDKELEQKVLKDQPAEEEAAEPTSNGTGASETEPEAREVEDAPITPVITAAEETTTADVTQAVTEEEETKAEEPKAPEQTPAASPPKQATPQPAPAQAPTPAPAPAAKPSAPKTWASLAASANRVATPATPSTASSASSQAKPAQAAKTTTPTTSTVPTVPSVSLPQSAPNAPAAPREDSPAEGSQGDEWTAVSSSHNRQQSRQTNQQQQEGPQNRGYIKNVFESIDGNELKSKLEEFGELSYFDISRQKNCAFVDFKTTAGYQAATNAGPFEINGESIYVEERRYRMPGQFQGPFRGNPRGRGGPNQGQQRGNFQGRGNYVPRGNRGSATGAPRGRGSSQAS